MIKYILTKIRNKYKLYLCLIIGIVSIIMVFAMIMMFREGSRDKLIQKGFTNMRESTGTFPATISRRASVNGSVLENNTGADNVREIIDNDISSYEKSWNKYLQLPVVSSQRVVIYRNLEATYSYVGYGHVDLGYIDEGSASGDVPEEDMSKHYEVIAGADLGQDISEYTKDGTPIPEDAYPVLISEKTANDLDMVPGELITIKKVIYGGEESETPLITLYVNGIINEKPGDYFWSKSLEECGFITILKKSDFCDIVSRFPKDVFYDSIEALDYRYINTTNVDNIENIIKQFIKKDEFLSETMQPIFTQYHDGNKSVEQMLYVIVLPLIVLVLIFIGMIAFRIIDSEVGELTTLRSRGLSRLRLIDMYVKQSFILTAVSFPLGLLAAYGFGKLVAGVDDFMGFSIHGTGISVRDYRFNLMMVFAGAIGAILAIIVMLIPVVLFFRKKKSRRNNLSTPAWEKYFLDVALLLVSIYLLFNYNKQIQGLSNDVLQGKGIDPVIFINATLFLFACGMLMLRIIFYIVKLIYKIGRKKFQPVTYAGLLQIMRTRKASGVISVFLVMTVAMSLFNANMARTINANKEARLEYNNGTDFRIREKWNLTVVGPPGATRWKYTEPDYENYNQLVADGTFASVTKVLITSNAVFKSGTLETKTTIMGIHTKEFGETAYLRDGLTDKHWYNYLNALAEETEGVIISRNLAKMMEKEVGDSLVCEMNPPPQSTNTAPYANVSLKIVGIVDSWPGYEKYYYIKDDNGKLVEKERYLAIMNYGTAINSFTVLPYEIWGRIDSGFMGNAMTSDELKEKLSAGFTEKRRLDYINSWRDELREEKSTAIIQITNGLFTADFLIALILCIIGYMIYWITSIRDRELLFGIYRAMGISRSEINNMLGLEQIFLSLMSIFAGVLSGTLASKFFVKVFAAVYLPQRHNVTVFTSSYGSDMIKMGVVLLIVVVVCVFWIRRIVRSLNITEALKLGED